MCSSDLTKPLLTALFAELGGAGLYGTYSIDYNSAAGLADQIWNRVHPSGTVTPGTNGPFRTWPEFERWLDQLSWTASPAVAGGNNPALTPFTVGGSLSAAGTNSEMLAAAPGTRRIAVDLEMWTGGRHHWDAGACRCPHCVREYRGGAKGKVDPTRLTGLLAWEEAALERRLVPLLRTFSQRHPGVELGVFDLDLEAFPHRALARALARTAVPTADWTECTYSTGSPSDVVQARRRLKALGLSKTPIHAGLWLKRFRPNGLPRIARNLRASADGWFVFTTYSLWLDPSQLQGPYVLPAAPASYWSSLREANTP